MTISAAIDGRLNACEYRNMEWNIAEIENEWLRGDRVPYPPEDVLRAFAAAERVRGREWVLSTTSISGGGRQWGFMPFFRVYDFGRRVEAVFGAAGAETLLTRLSQHDRAAESELAAIYLLRSQCQETLVEIGLEVEVGDRLRRPDFRIRHKTGPWTYVEVTQLNRSVASDRTQSALRRIADQVITIPHPFVLEVVFWRDPTEAEENELVRQACEASQVADGGRRDLGDFASLMVKSGDPALVVPSILPEDDGTRMAFAQTLSAPGEPSRQILVRAPFADQRAEVVLTAEARQLPKAESGLVMVDVAGQPSAFESWANLIPRRFTRTQHTRVGGVLLFMTAMTVTALGMKCIPYLKLILNPHAANPTPAWITIFVEERRAETQRLTGQPD
jgi:hypothetical protein